MALAIALAIYVAAMFALALRVHGQVHDAADFFVAGRRLSLPFATATLFGTWFGAGTLLASADEVAAQGLRAVAMEPLGAGLCLILAGLFVARPLWQAKLLTLGDFYRDRFGGKAEWLFAISAITYLGWIAAQLVGMAGLLNVLFGVPLAAGLVGTAVVALAYTLLGGMWSVTLTDAVQITVLLVGLVAVLWSVLTGMGDGTLAGGAHALAEQVATTKLTLLPTDQLGELVDWLNLLLIGSLGNLAGNDLMQRVFSARSAKVAQGACVIAGVGYIVVGIGPAVLGLAASVLLPPSVTEAVLPALAQKVLSPGMTILFVLALVSAVLSTLDSAILSAATVTARNLIKPMWRGAPDELVLTRWTCVAFTAAALGLAFVGESAYVLLEGSYALSLAGPFVPLVFGLFWRRGTERAAVASLVLGYGITLLEMIFPDLNPPVPMPLIALAVSTVSYVALALSVPAPPAATPPPGDPATNA
ncbi:MAG: sodium:solute symporter family protein [Myxococcales bacterium]|nr:sodium:solute symporter family protein [Myxococcales bacterium]MCB9523918.1 sodium:solute symporter family protein [Myxococcales bacterium]